MQLATQLTSGDTSLDELDRLLRSDDAPSDCMLLSELDGFLTGIVVGPQPIMPSEWLPVVWGEDELLADNSKAQAIVDAVLRRYQEIVAEIAAVEIAPIFWHTGNGDVITNDWAVGFGEAMALRYSRWQELSKSEAGIKLLLPIMLLRSDAFDNAEEWADLVPGDRTEAVKQAADELHVTILAMACYWKTFGGTDNVEPRWRGSRKVGRNEPCPCGSGKKFKKCCL